MSDYKYEAQLRAEELAEEETGKDFYSLPLEKQCKFYVRGLEDFFEQQVSKAEGLEDR